MSKDEIEIIHDRIKADLFVSSYSTLQKKDFITDPIYGMGVKVRTDKEESDYQFALKLACTKRLTEAQAIAAERVLLRAKGY